MLIASGDITLLHLTRGKDIQTSKTKLVFVFEYRLNKPITACNDSMQKLFKHPPLPLFKNDSIIRYKKHVFYLLEVLYRGANNF